MMSARFSDSVFSTPPIEFLTDDQENEPANCNPCYLTSFHDGFASRLGIYCDEKASLTPMKVPSPLKVSLPSHDGSWMSDLDGEIVPVDINLPVDVVATQILGHDGGYDDPVSIPVVHQIPQFPSVKTIGEEAVEDSWGRRLKAVSKLTSGRSNGNRKKTDLKKFNPPPSNYSGITTLMIRGIPCSFSQEELLSLVASAGLGETCDFFYLPRAPNNASNLGYAFINFTETIHAWTCAFTFHGIRLNPQHSTKTCTVSPADIQGIPNLRKHFRRTAVSRGQNGPLFLNDKRNNNLRNLMLQAGQAKKVNDEAY
jgi:hypothetical protein